MSARDFPWQRVLDFLSQVPPFDSLGLDRLKEVASQMEIAYYPRGTEVIKPGGRPSSHLHVIQGGSATVELLRPGQEPVLVDVLSERDTFGATSLLRDDPPLFSITAREDLVCYVLPGGELKALVDASRDFDHYFKFSLTRDVQAVSRSAAGQSGGVGMGATLISQRVGDLMRRDVLTCQPATTLRAAARLMTRRQVGSIVVSREGDRPMGILTDTDFRKKVMLEASGFDQPVADFMSHPVKTVDEAALGLEALLTMSRHNVHHLVVTSGERMVGLVSDRDLQAVTGSSPVALAREIEKIESVDELVGLHPAMDSVLETMLRLGGSARDMLEVVTEFNDRITHKLLGLITEQMEHDGSGRPPVPFCWIALGSEGRREQTLRTDQDNALVFANVPDGRLAGVQAWFLEYARRVVSVLERCGFPLCKGEVMASNPRWCLTESQWVETFRSWVAQPNPATLRNATIFFDFRAVYAEADYVDNIRRALSRAIEGNRLFLRYMAKNALYNRPPLGFLRQLVVERGGEHKNKLNLKGSGAMPLTDAARVLALDQNILHTNTLMRLDEIGKTGILKSETVKDLTEAFNFITIMRIRHHLDGRSRGVEPDNYIDPGKLNTLQRKTLKESFRVITELQSLLEHRFQTWLLT